MYRPARASAWCKCRRCGLRFLGDIGLADGAKYCGACRAADPELEKKVKEAREK